jgi:hypothetical protein
MRLPQSIVALSAPSAFHEHPETEIFRDTHNRCGALGTVWLINLLALEGLAFGSPISIPLPETLYEVHTMLLPLGFLRARRAWRA